MRELSVVLKETANELTNDIRSGRKEMKEKAKDYENLYNNQKSYAEMVYWDKLVTGLRKKSEQSRSVCIALAYLNHTPFHKVEVYYYDEKGTPHRFDGKPIRFLNEDTWGCRCAEFRKALIKASELLGGIDLLDWAFTEIEVGKTP